MKFNKIGVGILSLSILFCGVVLGATRVDTTTNRTYNTDIIFYDGYTENDPAQVFTGSTTTSGGTSTFSQGCVDVSDLEGRKDFGLLLTPGGAGGSITVTFFGVFGTTTVESGTNSAGVALLRVPNDWAAANYGMNLSNPLVLSITSGTSTTLTFYENPEKIAVGIQVTAGTVTVDCGMTAKTKR